MSTRSKNLPFTVAQIKGLWYNIVMIRIRITLLAVVALGCATILKAATGAAASPSSSTRWATDAYPGFDSEEEIVEGSKKTPRWFSWINGPAKEDPATQLDYARDCEAKGSWRTARRAYDALVREWPSSPEAPIAQEKLADLYFSHYLDYEEAFEQYKYLLDFFSTQCDYKAVSRRLWEVAKLMEEEGKTIVFFRFANTVDVRRAFESVVRRAPGEDFTPDAMLRIAKLREDDEEHDRAVQVYENIRNLFPLTPEAKLAQHREGAARMFVLRRHEYNRQRCKDTIEFLRMALATNLDPVVKTDFTAWLAEAVEKIEDDAFNSAKFYDSRTRTRRSAIDAYEKFLRDYPASRHADAARARLNQLQSEVSVK